MKCDTCHRDPKRMHSELAECSHCECPHRKPLTAQPRQTGWRAESFPVQWRAPLDFDLQPGARRVIREQDIHELVLQAIIAAQNGQPMPQFGYLANASREQMARLNRAYDDTRNQFAARHKGTRRR